MAEVTSVKLIDRSSDVLKAFEKQVVAALEAIGMQAESYAKLNLETHPRRVDTGLLRNSITHAIDGKAPKVKHYRSEASDKHGNPVIPLKTGVYTGSVPEESGNNRSVYIGTNVEYAIYVEYGVQNAVQDMEANHFLRNAASEHSNEYKAIFEMFMKD